MLGELLPRAQEWAMNHQLGNTDNTQARVLLHSHRRVFGNFHFCLGLHEFEDIISLVDSIDLLAPGRKSWYKYGTRVANRLASSYNNFIYCFGEGVI